MEPRKRFNINEYVPPIMAIGTWLFYMFQSYHGVHFVPDEWVVAIVLFPFSRGVYLTVRDKVIETVKCLKKD